MKRFYKKKDEKKLYNYLCKNESKTILCRGCNKKLMRNSCHQKEKRKEVQTEVNNNIFQNYIFTLNLILFFKYECSEFYITYAFLFDIHN